MSTNIPISTGHGEGHVPGRSLTRYLAPTARILMGLLFVLTGLNGFLRFLPEPDPATMPQEVIAFMSGLVSSRYMMPLISGTQLLVGVLLVLNRFVPMALVLIAPVIVNIILFHLVLAPASIGPGLVVLILEIYLVYAYRNHYRSMVAGRATPR